MFLFHLCTFPLHAHALISSGLLSQLQSLQVLSAGLQDDRRAPELESCPLKLCWKLPSQVSVLKLQELILNLGSLLISWGTLMQQSLSISTAKMLGSLYISECVSLAATVKRL